MKGHLVWFFTVINLVLLLSVASAQGSAAVGATGTLSAPLGTAFTYQGRLKNSGAAVNGACDFQFDLMEAASGGTPLASKQANGVAVTDGRFAVQLDFGASAFDGAARWLQVAVRCPAGSGAFTQFAQRQALLPAPYALRATSAGSVAWSGVTGVPSGFADGVDNGADYTAGNGLALNGVEFSVAVPLNLSGSQPRGIINVNNPGPYDPNNDLYPIGVWAVSADGRGLEGDSTTNYGVAGFSDSSAGIYGRSLSRWSIFGLQLPGTGGTYYTNNSTIGVLGTTDTGLGVYGASNSNIGVYGFTHNSSGNYAGYFVGNVRVSGTCCSAAAGTYQIDHPLDPANKSLTHAAVESPDMKNIYDGVATLDAEGAAVVELPDYFEALNQDFRYQLTCIGGFAPVYIAKEISGNRFTIAGGKPGMKVSWQVTGIRSDPYAKQHPVQVEADKTAQERGKYIHPESYGQPETQGIDYANQQSQQSQPATSSSKTP